MKHSFEIARWASKKERAYVWVKSKDEDFWTKTKYPIWKDENEYVVDDSLAEFRKEWIDRGRPEVQVKVRDEWVDEETPSWIEGFEYRFKPNEIKINAKHLPLLCKVSRHGKPACIRLIIRKIQGGYVDESYDFWENAEPLTKEDIKDYLK